MKRSIQFEETKVSVNKNQPSNYINSPNMLDTEKELEIELKRQITSKMLVSCLNAAASYISEQQYTKAQQQLDNIQYIKINNNFLSELIIMAKMFTNAIFYNNALECIQDITDGYLGKKFQDDIKIINEFSVLAVENVQATPDFSLRIYKLLEEQILLSAEKWILSQKNPSEGLSANAQTVIWLCKSSLAIINRAYALVTNNTEEAIKSLRNGIKHNDEIKIEFKSKPEVIKSTYECYKSLANKIFYSDMTKPNMEEAIVYYNKAMQLGLKPDNQKLNFNPIFCNLILENYQEVQLACTKLISKLAKNSSSVILPPTYLLQGLCFFLTNELDNALKSFDSVIKLVDELPNSKSNTTLLMSAIRYKALISSNNKMLEKFDQINLSLENKQLIFVKKLEEKDIVSAEKYYNEISKKENTEEKLALQQTVADIKVDSGTSSLVENNIFAHFAEYTTLDPKKIHEYYQNLKRTICKDTLKAIVKQSDESFPIVLENIHNSFFSQKLMKGVVNQKLYYTGHQFKGKICYAALSNEYQYENESSYLNAIQKGFAARFYGNNGLKYFKNNSGKVSGIELKINSNSRLYTSEMVEAEKAYAIVFGGTEYNHRDLKNNMQDIEMKIINDIALVGDNSE